MNRDEEAKNLRLFDSRTIERNIRKGLITRKDYEKHLKALPDVTDKVAPADAPRAIFAAGVVDDDDALDALDAAAGPAEDRSHAPGRIVPGAASDEDDDEDDDDLEAGAADEAEDEDEDEDGEDEEDEDEDEDGGADEDPERGPPSA